MKFPIIISLLFCCGISCISPNANLTTYKKYFDNDLKGWTNSFKDFKLSGFRVTDTLKFHNLPYGDTTGLKEFYDLYKPALSFSVNETKFLDIYSYWLNLERNGNKVIANPEADQMISLCDLKNNSWQRIYFCGLSTRIDEALWLTNTKFILVGTVMDENNVVHPIILVGDTDLQQFLVYDDNQCVATAAGYTSSKLKSLNIQEE